MITTNVDIGVTLDFSPQVLHGTHVRLKHKIATETVQGATKELSGMKDLPLHRMPKILMLPTLSLQKTRGDI